MSERKVGKKMEHFGGLLEESPAIVLVESDGMLAKTFRVVKVRRNYERSIECLWTDDEDKDAEDADRVKSASSRDPEVSP